MSEGSGTAALESVQNCAQTWNQDWGWNGPLGAVGIENKLGRKSFTG